MNEQEADKLLRNLFQRSGVFTAPEGLDVRIIQRIAVSPRVTKPTEQPLLPKWAWMATATILAGIGFIPDENPTTSFFDQLPAFDWSAVLTSPWLNMSLASLTILLGLNILLDRKRAALKTL